VRATVSRNTGFALVAYAFLVTMIGTTLPTPLYPLFEQRYSFGELMVTVIFAVYAFGVIAGLLVFGNLSDEIGRKPVLLTGLAFSAISAFLFVFAGSLVPIFAGRVVSGSRPACSPGRRPRCSSTSPREAVGGWRASSQWS
jgi:MFS family permease